MNSAIIVAGGSSTRFGDNKLFIDIMGKPLIEHTVSKFFGVVDEIILVVNKDDKEQMQQLFNNKVHYVLGGDTRTQSVINGLECLDPNSDYVAIHDGARPYVSQKLINKCFRQATITDVAIPVLDITETVFSGQTPLDRDKLHAVQTPQVFDTTKLKRAYAKSNTPLTDDSQIWLACYGGLTYVEGERSNIKITYHNDVKQYMIGYGYDIHRLVKGRKLILGGVDIPFVRGLLGHSDADVVIHSVMDALLSVAHEKDIGHIFPNTDPRYKDIDSMELLRIVDGILRNKNITTLSISSAIVCEKPKLAPYIDQMRQNIANALSINTNSVTITITTAESVGEIGHGKAIACRSVALGVQE